MNEHPPPPAETAPSPSDGQGLPVAPPDPAWEAAAAQVQQHLAALTTATQALRDEAEVRWTEQVLKPLQHRLRLATKRHARLLDAAAFEAEPAAPASDLWLRLRTYRLATNRDVLAPLLQHFTEALPGEQAGEAFRHLLDATAALEDTVPEAVLLSDPPDLYTPCEGDALRVRLKKSLRRAGWQAARLRVRLANGFRRLMRRNPLPLPARSRRVPLRALTAYHLRVRLARQYVAAHERLQQDLARCLHELETAWDAWTLPMLEAETGLDRLSFHHPSRPVWPQTERPAAPSLPDAVPPDESPRTEGAHRFHQLGQALQRALEALLDGLALPSPFDEETLGHAQALFALDLRYGGTRLLDPGERRLPSPPERPEDHLQARVAAWRSWHAQVRDRLRLYDRLLDLREAFLVSEDALLAQLAQATLAPIFDHFTPAIKTLHAAADQARHLCSTYADDPSRLAEALRQLRDETLAALQLRLTDLSGLVSSDQALAEAGRQPWEQLRSYVATLPSDLQLHPLEKEGEPVAPVQRPVRIDLRELAENALSDPFATRLHGMAEAFRKSIVHVWREAEQVLQIVSYNLEAAADELEKTPPSPTDDEAPQQPPVEAARELAVEGLGRAAHTLAGLIDTLRPPWVALEEAVFSVYGRDWTLLLRQVRAAGAPLEWWVELQAKLRRLLARLWHRSLGALRFLLDRTRKLLLLGRRRATQLRQQAQTVVGVTDADAEARAQTLDALVDVEALQRRLPLIYRKLFAFAPLDEPSLIENRARDLRFARRHFERWLQQRPENLLLVHTFPGAGCTSFLKVLHREVLHEARVLLFTPRQRYLDEATLARDLARLLELPADDLASLEELEAALLSRPRPEKPLACLIDDLEFMMLRTPDGNRVIERLLLTLARTDTRVYWAASINSYAWNYLKKTLPQVTDLATDHALTPFDRDSLEALILSRHRRSGLPLRFTPPPHARTQPLQRLFRRARTEEEEQALYRRLYFDRLYRLSGQNLMLALYYWLRSADFEDREDVLTIRPIQPLDFRFMAAYDMPRAFSLKAFLRHGTLTLAEHNRIFRLSEAEGMVILEALLNQRIIEPLSSAETVPDTGRIFPGIRYRLHPLLLHPVTEFLRSRHIVY